MTPAELIARYDAAALAERLAWLLRHTRDTHPAAIDAFDARFASGPYTWAQVPMQERRSVIRAAAPKDKP